MLGLTRKKKLIIAIENNRILNKQKIEVESENKNLQRQILLYKRSLKGNLKEIKICKRCKKEFIPQRENQTYCQHCIAKRHKREE